MWRKKDILKFFERIFIGKQSNFLSVDIGTGSIKIAEIAWKNNQSVLKSIGILDLPDIDLAEGEVQDSVVLTESLRKLLSTTSTSCKEAVVAIGGRAVFIREVSFPTMSDEELREAIKWDIDKYVPYTTDTYYYDFGIIGPGDSEQEVMVLLVAAQRVTVDSIITIFKDVGLKLIAIDIEPLALSRTFKESENILVIDIGEYQSQVIIFLEGNPVVIRHIPIGGRRFTEVIMGALGIEFIEAERLKKRQNDLLGDVNSEDEISILQQRLQLLVDELGREVRRTIEYYQMQNRTSVIDEIYLTGGGAQLNNLATQLSLQFERTVLLHDPLAVLGSTASIDKQYLAEYSSHLGVVIGLGLRGGEI